MSPESMKIAVMLVLALVVVLLTHELGVRLGALTLRRRPGGEPVAISEILAASLGLAGFILAFTFGVVFERYHSRRDLVRQEADAIRTAWMRSAFLPEPDRTTSAALLRRYLDDRYEAVTSGNPAQVRRVFVEAVSIQRQLWEMAVVNARRDMNSDVAALYIESLNELANLHAERVSVALYWRIPTAIWLALCALIVIGMLAIGYQGGVAGGGRSVATFLMALAFSIVIVLIAALDRPESGVMTVTQQPLADVRAVMSGAPKSP